MASEEMQSVSNSIATTGSREDLLTILRQKLLENETDLATLLAVAEELSLIDSHPKLFSFLGKRLRNIIPYADLAIITYDDRSRCFSNLTQDMKIEGANGVSLGELLIRSATANGQLARTMQQSDIQTFFIDEFSRQQVICLPMVRDERNGSGALFLLTTKGRVFSGKNSESRLLQGVAHQLVSVLARIAADRRLAQTEAEMASLPKPGSGLVDIPPAVANVFSRQEEIQTAHNYSELIGTSEVMKDVFKLISKVSGTQSTVLLLGETGTGKELIARAIHTKSWAQGKVMVKVNCATLPATLIESELFGHERGSFTGATERRIGKFEMANGSTIFLDEIGEMPLDLQAKLLRALQEQEFERIGGKSVIKTNARIIAATNRDLSGEIRSGNFREDLFFRLNVFPITIPPLRERREDIPLLAVHFLEKYNKRSYRQVEGFSARAMKELMAYDWPGNVRELEHLIERTVLITSGATIRQVQLPTRNDKTQSGRTGFKTLEEIQRDHLLVVLKSCKGRVGGIGGAAQLLGLPVTTLHSRMKRLGIRKRFGAK